MGPSGGGDVRRLAAGCFPALSAAIFATASPKSLVIPLNAFEPIFAAAMLASRAFEPACSAAFPRRRAARVAAGIASSRSSSLAAGTSPDGVVSSLLGAASSAGCASATSFCGASFSRALVVTAPPSMKRDAGFTGFAAEVEHARLRRIFGTLVTKRDDELGHLILGVDDDLDAVDACFAAAARFEILDLELAPDLQELEIGTDLDLLRAARTDARLHRRAEPFDVQANARAARRLVARVVLLDVTLHELAQAIDAAAVERRELDAEVAPLAARFAPRHDALDHDFATLILEAADERRAFLGQVGGPKVHSARAHVERLGLERRGSHVVSANLDQRVERNPVRTGGASFLNVGHGLPRAGRGRASACIADRSAPSNGPSFPACQDFPVIAPRCYT